MGAIPPSSTEFQHQLQILRDAMVAPDECDLDLPDPGTSSYYRMHASLPHNQMSPGRVALALQRDQIEEAHCDRHHRYLESMRVDRRDQYTALPGHPRFINGVARRTPLGSSTFRVGRRPEAGELDVSPLCRWGYTEPWLQHKGDSHEYSYLKHSDTNTLIGALSIEPNHKRVKQQEADLKWIAESEARHSAQRE